MNEYFFILGRNTTLSIAEIESVLGQNIASRFVGKGFYIIESKDELNLTELQQTLGGTIKIGEIVLKNKKEIINYLKQNAGEKKLRFGINLYGCDLEPMQRNPLKAPSCSQDPDQGDEFPAPTIFSVRRLNGAAGILGLGHFPNWWIGRQRFQQSTG